MSLIIVYVRAFGCGQEYSARDEYAGVVPEKTLEAYGRDSGLPSQQNAPARVWFEDPVRNLPPP